MRSPWAAPSLGVAVCGTKISDPAPPPAVGTRRRRRTLTIGLSADTSQTQEGRRGGRKPRRPSVSFDPIHPDDRVLLAVLLGEESTIQIGDIRAVQLGCTDDAVPPIVVAGLA